MNTKKIQKYLLKLKDSFLEESEENKKMLDVYIKSIEGEASDDEIDYANNQLNQIFVKGNGETIYFLGNEGEPVTDMNRSICTNIKIKLDSSQIQTINFITNPSSNMSPISSLSEKEKKLEGFHWKISDRPRSREDLLR